MLLVFSTKLIVIICLFWLSRLLKLTRWRNWWGWTLSVKVVHTAEITGLATRILGLRNQTSSWDIRGDRLITGCVNITRKGLPCRTTSNGFIVHLHRKYMFLENASLPSMLRASQRLLNIVVRLYYGEVEEGCLPYYGTKNIPAIFRRHSSYHSCHSNQAAGVSMVLWRKWRAKSTDSFFRGNGYGAVWLSCSNFDWPYWSYVKIVIRRCGTSLRNWQINPWLTR